MYSRFLPPFAWLISFFILLFVYTKIAGPLPFSVNSVTTQKSTTFDVTGEGKVTAKPDIASITAGITINASSVKTAQEQINSVINKVSEAIKQTGVDSKDIQTTNYNINPTYDFTGGIQRITGYSASTNLSVKVRNLDNVNSVIDAATANGANQISGVSFEIDDKTKLENEARQKAVDEARKKAQDASKIAGFKLGRIINYAENLPGGFRALPMTVDSLEKAAGAPTQIEPGSSEITVTVTLSYELD
ncbi:SIMPL domain-containing protein [Candidatus Daviesbacteria bacterium]|nr:SIMPL domain-containing protein [Candidatus Daviesbacteria bacterium]